MKNIHIINQPSLITFLRSILLVTALLILLSIWQLVILAGELGVTLFTSKSWTLLLLFMGITSLGAILLLSISYYHSVETIFLSWTKSKTLTHFSAKPWIWVGIILFIFSLIAYSFISLLPVFRFFNNTLWVRLLSFWAFTLLGTIGCKLWGKDLSWNTAFVFTVLLQASLHRLISDLLIATSYPFSLGWAETTRFYLASLFISDSVYGQSFNWPIINPSLHILLIPPYLINAPLWFHRLWQIILRHALLGFTAFVLTNRLSLPNRIMRFVIALWTFLYLFQGPLYFHLSLIVIIILWVYQ